MNSKTKLSKHYHQYLNIFNWKTINKLLSLQDNEIDHDIELTQNENEKASESSWSSLYDMTKDELLILRKTLTKYLDKSFIRVSNSSTATFVLFVKKLDDELRFCVNYRELNNITRKNRYSLFLINETLKRIDKVK